MRDSEQAVRIWEKGTGVKIVPQFMTTNLAWDQGSSYPASLKLIKQMKMQNTALLHTAEKLSQ